MTEIDIPKNQLLRAHQRDDAAAEIEGMKNMIPNLKTTQDRASVQQRMKRLEQNLMAQSPDPNVTGAQKDMLAKEARAIEERVLPGMLTQEEMRKNPAGAVGQFQRHEKAHKADILKWKNIQLMLEPDSNDPDLANFERLRPSGTIDRMRTDAQIPGKMSYTSVPQENWNQAFPGAKPVNSALEQTKRKGRVWGDKQKQEQSEKVKAYLERMKTSSEKPVVGLPGSNGQEGA